MSVIISSKTLIPVSEDVFYPETDGEPMAESDFQRDPLVYCIEALKDYFKTDSEVYVSGNLLIYYEQGNPYKSVAPDVFVVFGVSNHKRSVYKIWEEGRSPDVVIEIISKTTWKKDFDNFDLYARLGVKEYFLYDPIDSYINPVLQGFNLNISENYNQMKTGRLPGGILRIPSRILGLELRVDAGELRLYDSKHHEYLFNYSEEKNSRLRAELNAEKEKARAEKEKVRAEKEKVRANKAEEELIKLKIKLRELGILSE